MFLGMLQFLGGGLLEELLCLVYEAGTSFQVIKLNAWLAVRSCVVAACTEALASVTLCKHGALMLEMCRQPDVH